MEKKKHKIAFEAEVDPAGFVHLLADANALELKPGSKVTIQIFGGVLSKRLTALEVTNEEIEEIGAKQFEERENVEQFLESQGSLSQDAAFRRRFERMMR